MTETIDATKPKARSAPGLKRPRKEKAAVNTAKCGTASAQIVPIYSAPDPLIEPGLPFEELSHVTAPTPSTIQAVSPSPAASPSPPVVDLKSSATPVSTEATKAKARKAPKAVAMPSPISRANAAQERRITRAKLLEQWPELAEPENDECLIDTLDGATSDDAIIVQMVEFINYREDRAAARKARIKRINDEIAADELAFTKARKTLQHFMEETGRTKFDHDGISISVYPGRVPITVTDESKLPAEYWRIIPADKAIDKVKINATINDAIKAGKNADKLIAGVTIGNKPMVMAIR